MTKVKTINEKEALKKLKSCPKEVQDYCRSLQNVIEIQNQTILKSIKKIKEISK